MILVYVTQFQPSVQSLGPSQKLEDRGTIRRPPAKPPPMSIMGYCQFPLPAKSGRVDSDQRRYRRYTRTEREQCIVGP